MSTIPRTLKNLWKIGFKEYFHQIQTIGDTKAGTLVGIDRYGNKFFENPDELPLRTRWVDYNADFPEAAMIEPQWHAWMSYMNDNAPSTTVIPNTGVRKWGLPEHRPNLTQTRGAYKPYSTTVSKYSAWDPKAKPRE